MDKKLLICGSAIAVVVLVLASFSPVVGYKTLESEDELVEVTIEFCGFGKQNTIQLKSEEFRELDSYLDSVFMRLEEAENRNEENNIFYDVIEELNKYGLLGKFSIEQTQQLVTGELFNKGEMKFQENPNNKFIGGDENFDCIIYGNSTNTFFSKHSIFILLYDLVIHLNRLLSLMGFPTILDELFYIIEGPIFYIDLFLQLISTAFRHIFLHTHIQFGYTKYTYPLKSDEYEPARGNVWTNGTNGVQTWSGSFYGQYFSPSGLRLKNFLGFLGVMHFRGIRIRMKEENHFQGHAYRVKLGGSPPW